MKPEQVKTWVYLAGICFAALFWIYTIHGLPPRVDRLETIVSEHDKRMAANDVKLEIILDDTKQIKAILMNKGN